MAGMILKIVIASLFAFGSYFVFWWVPVIAFPIVFFLIPSIGLNDSYHLQKSRLEVRRAAFYGLGIAFLVVMAILFQKRLGSWYGWLVGAILAWLGCGIIAANLEEYLYFRTRD